MSNEKVNSINICMLLSSLTKASFFGSGFHYIYNNSGTGALFSVLLGVILGFFIVLLYLKIITDKPLHLKIKESFPKPIAYIINFFIIIISLSIACLVFFRIIDFLSTQYLTNTPSLILGLLVISLIFYLLCKNLEVLTRFGIICFFITGFLILINVAGLIPFVELDNYKPLELNFPSGFIKSSLTFALLFAGPCFFTTMFGRNNIIDKDKLNKRFIIFYFISALFIFLIFFFVLACLGNETIKLFTYPVYIVLKKISIFNFIESIQNITFFLWYIYLHILATCSLFFVKNTIISNLNIKINTKKSVIISLILCLIIFVLSFAILEENYLISNAIYKILPILLNLALVIISFIIFIIFKIKKIN